MTIDGFKITLRSYATSWRIGNSFRRKFTASWVWFCVHDLLTRKTRKTKREREGGRKRKVNFHVELVGASDHTVWQYARAVLKLHSHLRIRDVHVQQTRLNWMHENKYPETSFAQSLFKAVSYGKFWHYSRQLPTLLHSYQ